MRLLLRIKFNAHPILDMASNTRRVGVGLYPAAALVNHSCYPNTVYHHVNQGRTLVFRAIRDIAPGEEVTYAYIELCQPPLARAALLKHAFDFDCVAPPQRQPGDALLCAGAHGSTPPEGCVAEATRMVQRGMEMVSGQPQAGVRCLQEALHCPAMCQLHPCHQVMYDCHLALVAAASLVGDHSLRARHALAALQVWEATVGLGTAQLASLYQVHGMALHTMVKEKQVAAPKLPGASKQAVAALQAAYKIQGTCYGTGHPLVRATQKAAAEAAKNVLSA